MNKIIPTLDEVRALNGRIFAMLNEREREVLIYYRQQGRKHGVSIEVDGDVDSRAIAAACSMAEIDAIVKKTNATIVVNIA
jgi:hypothetical protein